MSQDETRPSSPISFGWRKLGYKRPAILLGTLIAALVVYALLPAGMGELPRRMVVVFLIAAVFWATEVIPLYATSLCVIGLQILLLATDGGLARVGEEERLSFEIFLAPFASPVIILFMGGFLLAAAVTRHGLDRQIAGKVLRPFVGHPLALIYGIMAITGFFSMWMSNTATTAMMIAIVTPLMRSVSESGRFHLALILAVPLGANIGGVGTPIGTPPNAVALAALRDAGFEIGFLEWMLMALPLAVVLMGISGFVLYLWLGPRGEYVRPELPATGPVPMMGKVTLAILIAAIVGWITSGFHGIDDAVIALLAAALLTALGVLARKDVDSIDWNILILMWGGLSLGQGMQATGLVDQIMQLPLADLGGFWLALAVVVLAVGLSTFMSNTAAANLIIPMAIAFPAAASGQLVVLTALACSFAMVLPISTPPNAIAFGTGMLPASLMVRIGGLTALLGVLILLAGYQLVLPMVLGL